VRGQLVLRFGYGLRQRVLGGAAKPAEPKKEDEKKDEAKSEEKEPETGLL
jgi:hypothetical protein